MINEYRKQGGVRFAHRSLIRHRVSIGEEKKKGRKTPQARKMTSRVSSGSRIWLYRRRERINGKGLLTGFVVAGIGANYGVAGSIDDGCDQGNPTSNFNPHTQPATGFHFSLPVAFASLRYLSISYSLVARDVLKILTHRKGALVSVSKAPITVTVDC